MLNEQLQIVLLDEERAIAALPKLLQRPTRWKPPPRSRSLRQLAGATGALDPEGERRLARVEKLFGAKPAKARKGNG